VSMAADVGCVGCGCGVDRALVLGQSLVKASAFNAYGISHWAGAFGYLYAVSYAFVCGWGWPSRVVFRGSGLLRVLDTAKFPD
jgi:hypothetical protein